MLLNRILRDAATGRGVDPAIADVIGGQVDSAFSLVPSVMQMIRGGNVRALAVSSAWRVAIAPEIPTIVVKDAGVTIN